jgi:asparagine synthase (glutamine-hydrolysing)
MCGITGFITTHKYKDTIIPSMLDSIKHRGPDNTGYKIFNDNAKKYIFLGHVRLSILDLTEGSSQPFEYLNLTLVFNGEIYNFEEIRNELIDYGYLFDTTGDTEVLIKSYHKWGAKCLDKLNGIFAFAIYNSQERSLFLARDRAGVKPLYYSFFNGSLIFSSQPKSIIFSNLIDKVISIKGLSKFLKYGFIPEPYSIYEKIFKLEQGHYLNYNTIDNSIDIVKYWDVHDQYLQPSSGVAFKSNNYLDFENLLFDSFKLRTISDVPIGLFLSGGYDSTYVLALLKNKFPEINIETFTIGFKDAKFDESVFASKISEQFGVKNNTYLFSDDNFLDVLNDVPLAFDEPFSDKSLFPTLYLSKLVSKKVKVVLSADGGDELFGGYISHVRILKRFKFLRRFIFLKYVINYLPLKSIKFKNIGGRFLRFQKSFDLNISQLQDQARHVFSDTEINQVLSENVGVLESQDVLEFNDPINTLLANDYKFYQSNNICVKVDRASMFYGLEAREPLLDYRLVEYLSRFPGTSKIVESKLKVILKNLCHKYINKAIIDRPKKGFSIPTAYYLKFVIKSKVLSLLSEDYIRKQNIFNFLEIKNIIDSFYYKNDDRYTNKLWNLFMFQIWYQHWIQNGE